MAVFFQQFSEVFIFPAGRFKVESLILDADSQIVQQFVEAINVFFKLLPVGLCLLGKFCLACCVVGQQSLQIL